MKILVVSDNHGDEQILTDLVAKYANQVDLMVHCGDAELSPVQSPMNSFQAVRGNNDDGLNYPQQRLLTIDDERILVVHGDHDRVNYSLTPLLLKAQAERASLVCYGHTHQLAVCEDEGILFINPGSISMPRGEYANIGGTFAIVNINRRQWQVDYYNRNLQPVPELHFEFSRH